MSNCCPPTPRPRAQSVARSVMGDAGPCSITGLVAFACLSWHTRRVRLEYLATPCPHANHRLGAGLGSLPSSTEGRILAERPPSWEHDDKRDDCSDRVRSSDSAERRHKAQASGADDLGQAVHGDA